MHIPKRRKLFIDPDVQGAMVRRALIYWFACVLFITLPFVIGKTLIEPGKFFFEDLHELWGRVGPVLICAGLALPLLIYDMVHLTNRFAGPMYRLRREMKNLAECQPARRLKFRDNDFWIEFATYFNQIAERVKRAEEAAGASDPGRNPTQRGQETCAVSGSVT
jgi:hypothetical protein